MVVGVAVTLGAAQVVADWAPPLAAWILFLLVAGATTALVGWMLAAAVSLVLAGRRERRGHPDEERAVTRARWRLGAR